MILFALVEAFPYGLYSEFSLYAWIAIELATKEKTAEMKTIITNKTALTWTAIM